MTPKTERTSRVLLMILYKTTKTSAGGREDDSIAFVILMKFWSILESFVPKSQPMHDIKRRTKPLLSLFLNRVIHT